ncbi:hypothetical protein CO667_14995 [Rhizobium sp. L43]|nr:hypothetical protein CO667_14995 [Rhizobium sp. L43]
MLVTGIQPRRVCAVNNCYPCRRSLAPKDLGALDSCDKHRNDGGEVVPPRPFASSSRSTQQSLLD